MPGTKCILMLKKGETIYISIFLRSLLVCYLSYADVLCSQRIILLPAYLTKADNSQVLYKYDEPSDLFVV